MTEVSSTATPASTSIPPIVVGVGPEEVESALEFAAEEALRAGCGLHLVHAVHVVPVGPETPLLTSVDVEVWGREVLTLAVKQADDLVHGAVPVTHEFRRGTPVQVLVEVGRTARMVVLEHRHLSRMSRIVNRTVAGGVAARPRGAALRVVHSWALSVHHEGMVIEVDEHRRWTERSRAEVRAALDALGDEGVAIDADVVVHPGRAIEAILEASHDAQLLVIGRHDPLVPIGSHIGPVARAVLREATCPVLLASPRARRAAYHA